VYFIRHLNKSSIEFRIWNSFYNRTFPGVFSAVTLFAKSSKCWRKTTSPTPGRKFGLCPFFILLYDKHCWLFSLRWRILLSCGRSTAVVFIDKTKSHDGGWWISISYSVVFLFSVFFQPRPTTTPVTPSCPCAVQLWWERKNKIK